MNIQNVDPLTLPSVPLLERRSLPECAAVYLVLNGNNDVLYIGASTNLAYRWLSHHRWTQLTTMNDDIRIAWLECNELTLLPEIETALINHFQPKLNRTSVPVPASWAKDKKQINVLLTLGDADKLKALADKQKRSVSQMAAILIQEGLERMEADITSSDKGAA